MGSARLATLEGGVLLLSPLEKGRQMAPPLGCPLTLTENLSTGRSLGVGCLDRRLLTELPFQIDSPMLVSMCEPLRKSCFERSYHYNGINFSSCILE